MGLIDASVSNRVAINWNGLKNRLGGYHEPLHTIIDSTFLGTLPEAEIRNGIAEILKIASCTRIDIFEILERHGESFIQTRFGQLKSNSENLESLVSTVIRQSREPTLLPIHNTWFRWHI